MAKRTAAAAGDPERTDVEIYEGDVQLPATTEREGDVGLASYLMTERAGAEADPTDTYRQIIQQVLAAETPDEVLTDLEAVSLTQLAGEVIVIDAFHENRSEYEAGAPFYFTIEGHYATTGEKVIANTGHQRVMAQLIRLFQLHTEAIETGQPGVFPVTVMVKQSRTPNRNGSYPIKLVKAETPRF